jgi:hypothetical protein
VDSFVNKKPIYRDDYIEPFNYEYVDYVIIEDIETKKRYELDLTYFHRMFKFKVKETKIFNTLQEVREFLKNYKGVYDVYQTAKGYELDLGEEQC